MGSYMKLKKQNKTIRHYHLNQMSKLYLLVYRYSTKQCRVTAALTWFL